MSPGMPGVGMGEEQFDRHITLATVFGNMLLICLQTGKKFLENLYCNDHTLSYLHMFQAMHYFFERTAAKFVKNT